MCLSGYCIGNVKEKKGMKPRTKKQQMFVDMASQLPPLTDIQRDYPKEHIFEKVGYYWKTTGKVWCQHCGHIYHQDHSILAVSLELDEETCPHCGAHLKLKHWHESNRREKHEGVYLTIITTFKGYQVFRTFDVNRYNLQGYDTSYTIFEVYQNWLDDKGNETIVSKSYTRSPFHFRWNVHSDWGIQKHNDRATGSYAMDDVFDVTDNYFYPRISVLPIFKRNGWQSCLAQLRGINIVELMQQLLSNSDIEMLAKTGQHDILRYWMRNGNHLSRDRQFDFFHAIRIANRNHYIVKDASMWYDLLDALHYLNLDTHNAHYVCPSDLKAAHDMYVARVQRIKAKEEYERKLRDAKFNEDTYKKEKGKYFGICFGNENVVITVIQSIAEMADEGQHMHHCVFSMGYYKKKFSLILSAKSRETGERIETIELNLKTFAVMQSRGVQNSMTKFHDEIVKLVEQNIGLFKKAA